MEKLHREKQSAHRPGSFALSLQQVKAANKQQEKIKAMTTEFITRLFVAAILGGIIGLERNYRAKEAGFRTHFLVALGSALFMVISQYGFSDELIAKDNVSIDPSRIASQVVTGIGFIGTGIIIFQKHVVKGLTTAAGLWVTSAIGLACGSGMYAIATAATLFVLLCLEILSVMLEKFGSRNISLTFTTKEKADMGKAIEKLKRDGVKINYYNVKEERTPNGKALKVTMEVKIKRSQYEEKVATFMNELEDIGIENIE